VVLKNGFAKKIQRLLCRLTRTAGRIQQTGQTLQVVELDQDAGMALGEVLNRVWQWWCLEWSW
jgi:hypothetical protein